VELRKTVLLAATDDTTGARGRVRAQVEVVADNLAHCGKNERLSGPRELVTGCARRPSVGSCLYLERGSVTLETVALVLGPQIFMVTGKLMLDLGSANLPLNVYSHPAAPWEGSGQSLR
jgi:hypothetical protein